MKDSHCIFCKIANGEIPSTSVYESDANENAGRSGLPPLRYSVPDLIRRPLNFLPSACPAFLLRLWLFLLYPQAVQTNQLKMQESGENYLKTIYLLQDEGDAVHSVDVARALNFSKPSVSRAMGLLKNKKYIEIAQNGEITLTVTGRKKAKDIVDKQEDTIV